MTPADDLPPLPGRIKEMLHRCFLDVTDNALALGDLNTWAALARAERDAEIERLTGVVSRYATAIDEADAAIKELQQQNRILLDSDPIAAFRSSERKLAEAEARVKELEGVIGRATAKAVSIEPMVVALADERDTLRTRIAELEERLMVLLPMQLRRFGDEPAPMVFWMIERLQIAEKQPYGWWFKGMADPTNSENWTIDATKAAHFPSGESAACALAALKPDYIVGEEKHRAFHALVKPTEHMWSVPPPDPPAPETLAAPAEPAPGLDVRFVLDLIGEMSTYIDTDAWERGKSAGLFDRYVQTREALYQLKLVSKHTTLGPAQALPDPVPLAAPGVEGEPHGRESR